MEIIKEMHGVLYNERQRIQKEEAVINIQLQDLNFRKAALVRRESELKRVTDVFFSAGANVGHYAGNSPDSALTSKSIL